MQVELKVGVMRSAGMESEVVGGSVSWMVSGERTWVSIENGEANWGATGVDKRRKFWDQLTLGVRLGINHSLLLPS